MMNKKEHWEKVYQNKRPDEVSWYKPHLDLSLGLILQFAGSKNAKIIDVGGGASTLAGDLLAKGQVNVTVLDLSASSLNTSKKQLGNNVDKVTWIEGDITEVKLPDHVYDLWHDRAVFHFLTSPVDRKKYVQNLDQSLSPEGTVIISTFSLKGPERCSGLNVVRHSPDTLEDELGKNYHLVENVEESHQTPFGTTQEFIYCVFKRKGCC